LSQKYQDFTQNLLKRKGFLSKICRIIAKNFRLCGFLGFFRMYVIPAIDLLKGKCVRLIQGDYHRQITYCDDPVSQAEQFISAGAQWLHIVDLDGAKVGKPINTSPISAIAALAKLKLQAGGGIRDQASLEQLFDLGVERVIIGTRAVSDFEWFSTMAGKFTSRLILSLDARGSKVATEGWTREQPQQLLEFAVKAAKLPLAALIYTDITKDGMLSGPNLERIKAVAEAVALPVIAAGGVKELDDIKKLAQLGIEAVIVGRSLYEGTLDLAEAIKTAASR
jgi:phosphoribosylformimino-5-aminoimidazole carboxamide ribotide isomerase